MKPVDPILGMVKHPPPKEMYTILGVKVAFTYSILHLSLLAFMFTYLNIIVLFEFGVYPTLMTGNYFTMALNINLYQYYDALFRLIIIISCSLFGTFLDCYLLVKLKSRENAFAIIMLGLIPSVILVDVVSDMIVSVNKGRYTLCLLCIISGALVHWTQKLGYVCTAMTGNMFKLAELIFSWSCGYDIGGPRMHGEVLILLSIFFWSLTGAAVAVIVIKFGTERAELLPLLLCVPPNLYFGGCFEAWGWLNPEAEASSDCGSSTPAGPTVSAMHDNKDCSSDSESGSDSRSVELEMEATNSVGRPSRTSTASSLGTRLSHLSGELFVRRAISVDEAKEMVEEENSFNIRKQKELFLHD